MTGTTPATNARFVDMGDGIISEMISNQAQFFYNPSTGEARAIFNGHTYLSIGGTYHSLNDGGDILEVDFSSKMPLRYVVAEGLAIFDPVTGLDLSQVSVAGVMTIIKAAYDYEFNQRDIQRKAAIAAAIAIAAQVSALEAAKALNTSAVVTPNPNGTVVNFTKTDTAQVATFTDSSSVATGNTITAWSWIFGDSLGSSTVQNPTYQYATAGNYNVELMVTDSTGAVTKQNQPVTISP